MNKIARQLQIALGRLLEARFSRDRATAIDDAAPVIRKAIQAMEKADVALITETERLVDRLLAAVGANKKIKVGEYHIANSVEFATVIRELIRIRGPVEDITLQTNPKLK
jgi:hypothetical protein